MSFYIGLCLSLSFIQTGDWCVLSQLGKFMITASFGMVYQYATEIFPNVVRNAGLGS